MEIQTTIYNLASLTMVLIFYYNNNNKRRKQGIIMLVSGIILISFSFILDYILGFKSKQNLIPFWLLLWILVVLFCIKKYRFLNITPAFINKDISENIEEGIILLDHDLKIIFKNKALLDMLNINDNDIYQLRDIIFEKEIFDKGLSDLIKTQNISFPIRLNLINQEGKKHLLTDIKVKKIIDEYKDISGFLLIISRVKDLEQLKSQYNISSRELDVIHLIAAGSTNKKISELLNISGSTVKSNTASIYNKLEIKNKVELLNLLKRYGLA